MTNHDENQAKGPHKVKNTIVGGTTNDTVIQTGDSTEGASDVENTIVGGTFHGLVIQAGNIGSLNFDEGENV